LEHLLHPHRIKDLPVLPPDLPEAAALDKAVPQVEMDAAVIQLGDLRQVGRDPLLQDLPLGLREQHPESEELPIPVP
jgi:hypothetical protein